MRCAAVADWTRACAHFKSSLEAMILLFGKMDVRTISVAKLLHSARKGRVDGTGAEEAGEVREGEQAAAAEEAVTDDLAEGYCAADVVATPRTIEVTSANEVAPAYKDTVAITSPKIGKHIKK